MNGYFRDLGWPKGVFLIVILRLIMVLCARPAITPPKGAGDENGRSIPVFIPAGGETLLERKTLTKGLFTRR